MRDEIKAEWSGKRVAVIGLGVSNLALIHFLKGAGANLSGRDHKTVAELGERLRELESLGIELILGSDYLKGLEEYDAVVVSPGVPKDLPELKSAAALGLVTSEIALVFRYSQAPIFGITGSSGKTTTTSLVGEILKKSGLSTYIGGNIGTPLINELENIGPQDQVLLELSSFQLEGLRQSPHGALITNIAENHLDFHHTMENYVNAKQNIYRQQKRRDFLVLNYDDPKTRAMAKDAPGQVFFFSLKTKVQPGAYLQGDDMIYSDADGEVLFMKRSELRLPGEHNVANFLAAVVLSRGAGASWEAIKEVGQNFLGVSHRLELVGEVDGVRYYNDSIATTPDRTLAALRSFTAPIILIAGGSDKQLSFDGLGGAIHQHVRDLILLGVTAPKIQEAVLKAGDYPLEMVFDLKEAVLLAQRLAKPGDVVLLSPACASYDMYANFIARGAHFRELVHSLVPTREQEEIT